MNRMFMVRVQFIKEQEATNMPRLRRSTLTHSPAYAAGRRTGLGVNDGTPSVAAGASTPGWMISSRWDEKREEFCLIPFQVR